MRARPVRMVGQELGKGWVNPRKGGELARAVDRNGWVRVRQEFGEMAGGKKFATNWLRWIKAGLGR
jgi:hypothetical protein